VSREENVAHIQERVKEYNSRQKETKKHKILHLYDYNTINPWEYGLSQN